MYLLNYLINIIKSKQYYSTANFPTSCVSETVPNKTHFII